MTIFYLLFAGVSISLVHFYLIWRYQDSNSYSISEHAMQTQNSLRLYIISHVVCEVFLLLFAYNFYLKQHDLVIPFYLFVSFAVLDLIQALLPSRGRTEKIHFVTAYISWVCYLLAGVISLFSLTISQPYKALATLLLFPILGMFFYMHINRSKLYPYQLAIVPLFVLYMFFVVIGSA